MKYYAPLFILAASLLSTSGPASAQRFNHANFSRPAAPRPEVQRSAPVMRSQPVARQAAPVQPERTINGGSRNYGNHSIEANRNVAPVEREAVNPRADARSHVNIYHTNNFKGNHPYYYHPYHPYYWGPRWHPVGFFLSALAANAIRIAFNNQWYYYDDGCFYLPQGSGYAVVIPPIGAVVGYLPDGYETCQVGDAYYYYYAGVFYTAIQQGYQVIPAPAGAVVTSIPDGAIEQTFNGESVLFYNNTYFAPILENGQDAYEVVSPNG
ncbi:MAG TPA: DUF6515 family protein [Puia sp.]|nr:DUF6515 family protein [Puia sp.]